MGLDNWPFGEDVSITDFCAEGMADNRILRGPGLVNVKSGRLKGGPATQAWEPGGLELALRLGHFCYLKPPPLSGLSVILLESEGQPHSSLLTCWDSTVQTGVLACLAFLASPWGQRPSPSHSEWLRELRSVL